MTEPVDRARAQAAAAILAAAYGPRPFPGRGDPLGELVQTILSQSTSDLNSGRAYAELRRRLPTWEEVLDAPVEEVLDAIRQAGLGNVKAPRIQQALADILRRTGGLSLDFLAEMPMAEARAWLLGLDGVGPKTAACVLMFALGMPALPVDTHVHRVSQRLGLIAPRVSAERAHALLESALDPGQVYPFHLHMIQHGRQVCHARAPACGRCALASVCAYASLS
jgi:endonuclease-3